MQKIHADIHNAKALIPLIHEIGLVIKVMIDIANGYK